MMEKLSGIIPQFYYDLIARVTPGAVFTIVLGAAYWPDFPLNYNGPTLTVITLFVASYLFGLVLDFSSEFLHREIGGRLLKWHTDDDLWDAIEQNSTGDDPWAHSMMSVLTKMMAERTLLRAVLFELILFFYIFLFCRPTKGSYIKETDTPTIVIIFAISSFFVLLASISLHKCLMRRIWLWKIIKNRRMIIG
jgi:hypothetical protein